MAVHILTKTPNGLLGKLKEAIKNGSIVTWLCDSDGDFTHDTDQWKKLAWFRPKVGNNELIFNILKPQNGAVSQEVYAIYHGRFIESMLAHFDNLFTTAYASAAVEPGDLV